MIETVIFDCDGVLVNSEEVCWHCYEKAAKEFGFDFNRELYHLFCGGTFRDMKPEDRARFPKDERLFQEMMEKGKQYFHKRLAEGPIDLKPYVKDIVSSLQAQNIDMYIGSSTAYDGVVQRIKPWGIQDYFKGIVAGDMVAHKKPDPEIFNTVVEKYHLDRNKTIVIEDSANGIIAAHKAGLNVIAVPDLWPMDDLAEKGYCVVKNNLLEALQYIEENNR